MLRVTNIKLSPEEGMDKKTERRLLKEKAAKKLRVSPDQLKTLRIAKKSLDARDKGNIFWLYSVDVEVAGKKGYLSAEARKVAPVEYAAVQPGGLPGYRPVVVGAGPAGLFAALTLAKAGFAPIILERGQDAERRGQDVARLLADGTLNPESNVHFGLGGAGAYSDGKLTTGVKDPRVAHVFKTLAAHHAPEEILYQAKPHIGTDQLAAVLDSLRDAIVAGGGEFRFGHKLTAILRDGDTLTGVRVAHDGGEYELETRRVLLCIGNSARDTVETLFDGGLAMRPKAFAVGVRIEHPQSDINRALHGAHADVLPPAAYNMAYRAGSRGVYTFCMCPGGVVVPTATEPGRLAVNGMSGFRRDGQNANSAVVVAVTPDDWGNETLGGIAYQRNLEERAFIAGGGGFRAPAQMVGDFLLSVPTAAFAAVTPTYRPDVTPCNLRETLGEALAAPIADALAHMNRITAGFAAPEAVLTGVETRTSSPVTIPRNASLFANVSGLIPCGEGAGYAGGIVSAAVDGVRCAEAVLQNP